MNNILGLDWQTIKEFLETFGKKDGLFILTFFLLHGWVYLQYTGRLKDRQKEIDRLAQDNHEYRTRLLAIMDKHFSYPQNLISDKGSKKNNPMPEGGK